MKRIYMLPVMVMLSFIAGAQITVSPQIPAASMIMKDQVWNAVVVNNSPGMATLRMQIDIRDTEMGVSVLNASSGSFQVGKGVKIISVREVQPVIYNYLSNELSGNFLPCGNYQLHYKIIQETDKGEVAVADDVQKITIRPLSPPMLIHPGDKTTSESLRPQFSWVPPTPMQMYNPLLYDFKIVKMEEGQAAQQAAEMNVPVYFAENIVNPAMMIPSSVSGLEKGNRYAWFVIAKSGMNCYTSSAVHEFYIDSTNKPATEVVLPSFIKLKRSDYNKGIAPGGVLKISYPNELNEPEVEINISEPGSAVKVLDSKKIKLRMGENLLTYEAPKKVKLKEGVVYEFRIRNGRNENWSVLFEITDPN